MTATLITNIGELTTMDDDDRQLTDAAVVIDGDRFAWVGASSEAPAADEVVDAAGRAGLPGWVDSHSHLVFAGDRSREFEARMAGEAYSAGGIGVTVEATRNATDADLRAGTARLISEARRSGTTALEIKTGYGLDVATETRLARIAAEFGEEATYLGAHLVPAGSNGDDYTDLVAGAMLDAVADHVDWIDVFCERGAFDRDQSDRVLSAGRAAGLGRRVHGNQLGPGAGVRLAVEHAAASVDHCNYLSDADVDALAGTWSDGHGTVATLLPACDLSTRQPFGPARQLLDAGAEVALASNCNPGSSFTTSMPYVVATAVLQMNLSLREALRAATRTGAVALRRDFASCGERAPLGSVAPGYRADLQLLDAPSAVHLAYRPGVPLTSEVFKAGVRESVGIG